MARKREVSAEVARLRAEARRRHKAVTNKISRNRQNRIRISGTQYDPRRDLEKIDKYNANQLRAYIGELNKCAARTNQYVPDQESRPIPIKVWKEYKLAEAQTNAIKAAQFQAVENVTLPNGLTVREQMAISTPTHPHMANQASTPGHVPVERRPRQVASLKALQKLTKDVRERMSPARQRKMLESSKTSASKMFEQLGRSDLGDRIWKLDAKRFNIFWNYSGFVANELSLAYELAQRLLTRKQASFEQKVMDDALKNVEKVLEWAEEL